MSQGYSTNLVAENRKGSLRHVGVALGRACIKQGVSVLDVSFHFRVSRQTVYNWFKGDTHPLPAQVEAIRRYITTHSKK